MQGKWKFEPPSIVIKSEQKKGNFKSKSVLISVFITFTKFIPDFSEDIA